MPAHATSRVPSSHSEFTLAETDLLRATRLPRVPCWRLLADVTRPHSSCLARDANVLCGFRCDERGLALLPQSRTCLIRRDLHLQRAAFLMTTTSHTPPLREAPIRSALACSSNLPASRRHEMRSQRSISTTQGGESLAWILYELGTPIGQPVRLIHRECVPSPRASRRISPRLHEHFQGRTDGIERAPKLVHRSIPCRGHQRKTPSIT